MLHQMIIPSLTTRLATITHSLIRLPLHWSLRMQFWGVIWCLDLTGSLISRLSYWDIKVGMVHWTKGEFFFVMTSQSILVNPSLGLGPTKQEHKLFTCLNDLHDEVAQDCDQELVIMSFHVVKRWRLQAEIPSVKADLSEQVCTPKHTEEAPYWAPFFKLSRGLSLPPNLTLNSYTTRANSRVMTHVCTHDPWHT